ncbi:uncharacterized protein LOC132380871 [Hypanus sabinus]|uniref:uncharacterized protein LOC132380871 n=1 Tax=Hypanus sabinus TaxID=79690 RepID=UPI0028C3B6AC|nr:uncharacterized protein LOC132380871 [Hypanus sabinus]
MVQNITGTCSLTLTCSVASGNPISFSLWRGGEVTGDNNSHHFWRHEETIQVHCTAEMEDVVYGCKASNPISEDTAQVRLGNVCNLDTCTSKPTAVPIAVTLVFRLSVVLTLLISALTAILMVTRRRRPEGREVTSGTEDPLETGIIDTDLQKNRSVWQPPREIDRIFVLLIVSLEMSIFFTVVTELPGLGLVITTLNIQSNQPYFFRAAHSLGTNVRNKSSSVNIEQVAAGVVLQSLMFLISSSDLRMENRPGTAVPPTTVTGTQGHSVSLHPGIPVGPDIPEVHWIRVSPRIKIVTYSNGNIMYFSFDQYKNRITFHPGNLSLEIHDLRRNDSGDYEVIFTRHSGHENKTRVRLEVYEPVSGANIMVQNITGTCNLTLTCSVTSGNPTSFSWWRRGDVTGDNGSHHFWKHGETIQVHCTAEMEDVVYGCEASNPISEDTAQVRLGNVCNLDTCTSKTTAVTLVFRLSVVLTLLISALTAILMVTRRRRPEGREVTSGTEEPVSGANITVQNITRTCNLSLTCSVTSGNHTSFSWWRRGDVTGDNSSHHFWKHGETIQVHCTAEMEDVVYGCEASNPISKDTAQVRLGNVCNLDTCTSKPTAVSIALTLVIVLSVAGTLLIFALTVILRVTRRRRADGREGTSGTEDQAETGIIYTDLQWMQKNRSVEQPPKGNDRCAAPEVVAETTPTEYAAVMYRASPSRGWPEDRAPEQRGGPSLGFLLPQRLHEQLASERGEVVEIEQDWGDPSLICSRKCRCGEKKLTEIEGQDTGKDDSLHDDLKDPQQEKSC